MAYLIYTTQKNDTFDSIALGMYNDEFLSQKIISANMKYRDIITFEDGTRLKVPIIEKKEIATLPPWYK